VKVGMSIPSSQSGVFHDGRRGIRIGGARYRTAVRALLVLSLLVIQSSLVWAWGNLAHQRVNAAAIENLPEPLRSYFQAHQAYFSEHASEPDQLAQADPAERPHHYTEIEGYGRPPFRAFERRFVEDHWYPPASEREHGDSIWQIERFTLRLAQDLRRHRWQDANHDALFAAHYAADLTQPLHTVINFDGKLTNQLGIHARFETELVRDLAATWTFQPKPPVFIPDLRARIFHELVESYSHSNEVFAADRQAAATGGYLDPNFLPRFEQQAGPLALRQLSDAANFVSSLWYTAWTEAGKPLLPAASTMSRVRNGM